MKEAEIMKLLAEETEDESYGSPVHQDKVYIIMWHSTKSGGTYTELRKSVRGKNRFLAGLNFLGVDLREVQVFEQVKTWIPPRKTKPKAEKENVNVGRTGRNKERTTLDVHTGRGQRSTRYSQGSTR